MKKILGIILCLILSGCSITKQEKELYSNSTLQAGFDTIITLKTYANSEKEFNEIFEEVTQTFMYYHQLFDKYDNYDVNNIKTINDNAGIQPVSVEQPIIDLLKLAKQYSELSNHQFDVTLGPVLKLWHDVREKAEQNVEYTLPTSIELNQAKACSGWDKVEIDENNKTVYLNTPCASLDVGAIAKGYTTQIVSEMLINKGYTNGFIDAGGNIQFLGSKIDGESWVAGIQKPDIAEMGKSLVRLEIAENNAFVTSGDYQRYFIHNDEIMHHIIDPDTLYPAKHAKSITILTKDSGLADILSTTLYTMTYQEGLKFINQLKENNIQIEVIWIYNNIDEIKDEQYIEIENYYVLKTEGINLNY